MSKNYATTIAILVVFIGSMGTLSVIMNDSPFRWVFWAAWLTLMVVLLVVVRKEVYKKKGKK